MLKNINSFQCFLMVNKFNKSRIVVSLKIAVRALLYDTKMMVEKSSKCGTRRPAVISIKMSVSSFFSVSVLTKSSERNTAASASASLIN